MSIFKNIKVSKLRKCEWNYKEDDAKLAQKLKKNIEEHGIVENLIVRQLSKGNYETVNGNHRLDVLLELDIEEVMCCDMGKISDAQAKKLAILTNETKFPVDSLKLSELISEISTEFDLEELEVTMPFDLDELEFMADMEDIELETDTTEEEEVIGTGSQDIPTRHVTCPECGCTF